MTLEAKHNSFRTSVAFWPETTAGTTPVDAAAWITALGGGGTAFRMYVEEFPVEHILGEVEVENVDMQTRVHSKGKPHKGLRTADGGSMVSRMFGTGETYSTGDQVAENGLGYLLGHSLGGRSRGNHAEVTAVTSQLIFEVDDASNLAVGQMLVVATAAGLVGHAVQILAIDGVEITVDRATSITIAIGSKVFGTDNAYVDQAALTNPQDAGFKTLSILRTAGPHCWMLGGAHLGLTGITLERNAPPRLNWEVLAAAGYPPGDGAPSLPAFVDTIEGSAQTASVGRRTRCFLQTYGVTTAANREIHGVTVTPGVPVLPQDTVTETDEGMPGRSGYRTEPADSIIEIIVPLTTTEQTQWTTGATLVFTYWQIAACGYGWGVHARKCNVMKPPVPVIEGSNQWRMTLQPVDDETGATELAASKIIVFRY